MQVCEVGLFHVHKFYVKREAIDKTNDISEAVSSIIGQVNSWERTCTTKNVQNAWRAIGAVITPGGPAETTKLRFDITKVEKLLNAEKPEKKEENPTKLEWLSL